MTTPEKTGPTIVSVSIVQIAPAPGFLRDRYGNLYVGHALIELEIEWEDSIRTKGREIIPYGADGWLSFPSGYLDASKVHVFHPDDEREQLEPANDADRYHGP